VSISYPSSGVASTAAASAIFKRLPGISRHLPAHAGPLPSADRLSTVKTQHSAPCQTQTRRRVFLNGMLRRCHRGRLAALIIRKAALRAKPQKVPSIVRRRASLPRGKPIQLNRGSALHTGTPGIRVINRMERIVNKMPASSASDASALRAPKGISILSARARTEIGRIRRQDGSWLAFLKEENGYVPMGEFSDFAAALGAIPDPPDTIASQRMPQGDVAKAGPATLTAVPEHAGAAGRKKVTASKPAASGIKSRKRTKNA
jgi:hypothetical protein